jgi:SIS domain
MAGDLGALVDEVTRQPELLDRFARFELPKAPGGSIFVGAGDSYAAALAGFYASKGRCIALDPYSLASQPEMAEGLEVFFISISGRTSSNVLAARKVRDLAKETTALTAVEDSPLASSTAKVVRLPMAYSPRVPGMLSFSLAALAVIRMVGGGEACDFDGVFEKAKMDSTKYCLGKGTTYFLGNSLAYPAALYAAAKFYELLGANAHSELLEEFSHLELFSLKRLDAVNVFSSFDPSGMATRLVHALSKERYESLAVPVRGTTRLERFFHCVFVAQLGALDQARRRKLSRPRFLAERGKLHTSDSMIY